MRKREGTIRSIMTVIFSKDEKGNINQISLWARNGRGRKRLYSLARSLTMPYPRDNPDVSVKSVLINMSDPLPFVDPQELLYLDLKIFPKEELQERLK